MIIAGASPGETKMWAAVRENGDFFKFVDHVKTNKAIFEIFSPCDRQAIIVFHTKRGGAIPTGTPLTGHRTQGGYEKN